MSGIQRRPKPAITIASDVRAEVARDVANGDTYGTVAKRHGIHVDSVRNIADEFDVVAAGSEAKRARVVEASQNYNLARRLELLNRGFAEIEKLIPKIAEVDLNRAADVQAVITAIAILIDKRRLEEGEATSRQEHVSTETRRNAVLDELAKIEERRQASGRAVVGIPSPDEKSAEG